MAILAAWGAGMAAWSAALLLANRHGGLWGFFRVQFLVMAGMWYVADRPQAVRRRRRERGQCVRCGYDLRETPQQCPECGAIPSQPT